MSNKEMTSEQLFYILQEQAEWHETHNPAPAPWKVEVLERLMEREAQRNG